MAIIDSQVHVYEANTRNGPGTVCRTGRITSRVTRWWRQWNKVGVDGPIFISAFSMYRYRRELCGGSATGHPGGSPS